MNLKTILNKTSNGVKYILTQPTMIFRNKDQITLLNAEHVVNADESARPDLIALQYYGDQSKLEVILKWNAISDPFSINEGDILEIPVDNVAFYKLERPKEFEENLVKQQFTDGKRLNKKDQRRLDALKKKYGKDELLPPNVIPVGKKNYTYNGTRITFGAQAQTDAVVNSINQNLEIDQGEGVGIATISDSIQIGGENTGSQFEKETGGVWIWTGTTWIAVNSDLAQEIAGSLYGNYGNPNGNIVGSFEGQLYFDKTRGIDSEITGITTVNTGQNADEMGDNNYDGSNPTRNGNN